MKIDRPEEMHRRFRDAFNAVDLEKLVAMYEPYAALSPEPGTVVRGEAAIREVLGQLLAMRGTMEMENVSCDEVEDTAVTRGRWRMVGNGPDGKQVEMKGQSAELLRRSADGGWLIAIDYPFGASAWRLMWMTVSCQGFEKAGRWARALFNESYRRVLQKPLEHVLLIDYVPGAEGTQDRVYPKALVASLLALVITVFVFGVAASSAVGGLMGVIQFLWAVFLIAMGVVAAFGVVIVVIIFWVAFR